MEDDGRRGRGGGIGRELNGGGDRRGRGGGIGIEPNGIRSRRGRGGGDRGRTKLRRR